MIIELPFPDPKLNPNRSSGHSWKATIAACLDAVDTGFVQARVALESQARLLADKMKINKEVRE